MKKQYTKNYLLYSTLFLILFATACSLQKQITGTWQIASYSQKSVDGSTSDATNVGTIEFNPDGTGVNDMEFKIFGQKQTDQRAFNYQIGDNYVTIKPKQEQDTVSAKSWIIMESGRSKQKWKSTDGEGNVQTIVLEKKK